MSNPILQAMKTGSQQTPQISPQLIAQAKSMMGMPAQMQQVMRMLGGRDPQQMFYGLCQQKGIDPESILSQIR